MFCISLGFHYLRDRNVMWKQSVDALDLVVRGLIVGVVVSAPMGPVGLLTVRRTLNKGRWYGFVTGLGAAFSDIIYALVAGLGMSIVLDFVSNPRVMRWLQLVSSVMLFVFGYLTFRADPQRRMRPSANERGTLVRNAFTGFAITISNPLVVFLFLILFARFSFIVPGHRIEQAAGYASVFLGSLLWWYCLTSGVSKVRERFEYGGIVWINRIVGVAVMVVSLLAFYFTLRGRSLY